MPKASEKTITKILHAYTGKKYKNITDILNDKSAKDILYLEILINDKIPWEKYLHYSIIRKNYRKARNWYSRFKTLLEIHGVKRRPLKSSTGLIDMKEYRKFIEVLNYVR